MLQWPPILAKVQPHQRVQVTKRGSGTFFWVHVNFLFLLSCPMKSLRCLRASLSQQSQCPLSFALHWEMGAIATLVTLDSVHLCLLEYMPKEELLPLIEHQIEAPYTSPWEKPLLLMTKNEPPHQFDKKLTTFYHGFGLEYIPSSSFLSPLNYIRSLLMVSSSFLSPLTTYQGIKLVELVDGVVFFFFISTQSYQGIKLVELVDGVFFFLISTHNISGYQACRAC
ncbi:hypothetical protein LAZ67_11003640 [Cordylochernes scorpioides]|uniref:Uncharacterized protein n=1 Tax=Cordylochernes scorpioides TaxID=51811 RepID=A0ABY6L3Y7_9ARAC|nr:hypothetical protein LAZ67_11003640 [Cordylochernes scorpioides]